MTPALGAVAGDRRHLAADTRVVHGDPHRAQFPCGGDHSRYRLGIGHIHGEGPGDAASLRDLPCHRIGAGPVQIRHQHAGPASGQRPGTRPPDAGSRSGNYRYALAEVVFRHEDLH